MRSFNLLDVGWVYSVTFPRAYVRATYTCCGLRKNSTQGNRTCIFIPPRRYGILINDPVPGTNENTTLLRPTWVHLSVVRFDPRARFARTALYAGHAPSIMMITDLRLDVLSLGPRAIWGHVRCGISQNWPSDIRKNSGGRQHFHPENHIRPQVI